MIMWLAIGAFAMLFVTAALAPLESLSWFAGWNGKRPVKRRLSEEELAAYREAPEADFYLVYLSGIGAVSGTSIPDEEYPFIHALEERLDGGVVITDVYPYSVTNNGLTGRRAFAWVWKWIEKLRFKNPATLVGMFINLRNALQLFVSADRRYGPVYNLGIANEIYRKLLSHGYRPKTGKPIIVLGWSGGGQIALGSVTYLAPLPGPIYVISVGGMLSDDIGLEQIDHLWHLYGVADPLQWLGGIMFAGRWPILPKSPWNTAMANGKIDIICLGSYAHNGVGNYFDMESKLPNDAKGRSYGQKTVDTIANILADQGLLQVKSVSTSNAQRARKQQVEKAPQPMAEFIAEPVAEYMAEPMGEYMAEPIADEPMAEPMPGTVPE